MLGSFFVNFWLELSIEDSGMFNVEVKFNDIKQNAISEGCYLGYN